MRSASAPPTPQPPTPPDPPPARSDPIIAQNEERDKQRRKRGRAATILTGNAGQGGPNVYDPTWAGGGALRLWYLNADYIAMFNGGQKDPSTAWRTWVFAVTPTG